MSNPKLSKENYGLVMGRANAIFKAENLILEAPLYYKGRDCHVNIMTISFGGEVEIENHNGFQVVKIKDLTNEYVPHETNLGFKIKVCRVASKELHGRDFYQKMLPVTNKYVDIIFATREEATTFIKDLIL